MSLMRAISDRDAQSTPTINQAGFLYGVHTVRAAQVSTTVLVSSRQSEAEAYAAQLSRDPGVLAGAVTRFVLDTIGHTTPVALYVSGVRQQAPHVSDDRRIQAHGPSPAAKVAEGR